MQHSPYEIKEKLLQSLDHEYNVVDMAAVMEVITALEKAAITKEALEKTRIGRYINELRKKTTNEQLARRAKDLVKSWRKLLPQTPQRINGEEIVINIRPSPGSIPVLGPGPGPGFGPGPGPGNRASKTCISVPGTPRYKTLSPSMMGERSSSPYFSSASNSPLLNSVHQGSSLPSMPSNYAPVKFVSCNSATREEKVNSVNKCLLNSSNQSKNVATSHMFQPISPFASVKEISSIEYNNTYSGTIILPSQRIDSPNLSPECKTNSSSSSPSITVVNLCSQPSTPTIECSTMHSTVDIAKTNVANKRLRKENTFSNCTSLSLKELDNSNSNSKIGNGTSDSVCDEVILLSDSNALTNDNFLNSDSVDTDVQIISKTSNSRTPKRKRSLDKKESELQDSRLNEMIASLPSGSKHPKVKTTQQLIADLHAKKGFSSLLSADNLSSVDSLHASDAEVSRTKSELLKKFLIESVRHDSNHESPTDESSVSIISDCGSHSVPDVSSVINTNFGNSTSISHTDPVDEEINRILSALPPINVSEINLEDEMPSPKRPQSVSSDDLNRLSKPWEYVTGVSDWDGTWRSWQECTEQKSLGESFKILPYVNID